MRPAMRRFIDDPVTMWRSGSRESQNLTLTLLLTGVCVFFVLSLVHYDLVPSTAYFLWLVAGMMLLRFQRLVVLATVVFFAALVAMLVSGPMTLVRGTALTAMLATIVLIVEVARRQHSDLPGPLSEAMLGDLRNRLQSAAKIPPLPEPWHSQSAMIAADGVGYGGDFIVATLTGSRLEVILVDVCGKGVGAASRALQFGGALGGLIGALPPGRLFQAANDFLLRQHSDDTFATAAHVLLDLDTGSYVLTSAGHPPALLWSHVQPEWRLDSARGTALGIVERPELHETRGVLAPGDALMFYTDGVVESRTTDLDEGISWLRRTAAGAVSDGFEGAARRIIGQVDRGDDDRAVLIIERRAHDRTPADTRP